MPFKVMQGIGTGFQKETPQLFHHYFHNYQEL